MAKTKYIFNLLLGFLLLGIAGWLVVLGVNQFIGWYGSLGEGVQVGIIAAIPVVTVAIVGYFANKSLETRRSVEQAMRPKKLELYDEFTKFVMSIFGKEGIVKRPSDEEMVTFFVSKTPELMTFASNRVIEKWGKLRVGLSGSDIKDEEKMFMVEDFFREIRADLGHSKRGSHKGDILRLFINDIDQYIKK